MKSIDPNNHRIAELNHPMFSLFDLSSLRTGIKAGSLCPIETMKNVMEKMNMKELIIVYGLTESSPGMTATRVTDSPKIRSTTVGKAYPAVEVKVADPEIEAVEVAGVAIEKYGENEFPMTASGKIQKYKLREMALELIK